MLDMGQSGGLKTEPRAALVLVSKELMLISLAGFLSTN